MFFSSRRRHTRLQGDWSSDVCSSDLIALERKGIHPLGRYIFNSGYVEGWALYSEGLADEMKLFSGELDRLGMFGSQNWRSEERRVGKESRSGSKEEPKGEDAISRTHV